MSRNKWGMRQGFNFVRDVYGLVVPIVLLVVTVLSMAFLRDPALSIIVLPFTIIFLLTLIIGYFALGWFGLKRLPEERVLSVLTALAEEGGETTLPLLAEQLESSRDAIEHSLQVLFEIGPLSFFWDTPSGRVYVPRASRDVTHCSQCAADIPAKETRGRCANCQIYFVRSERKKPFSSVP